jgi:AcrR family transcriptional regulator
MDVEQTTSTTKERERLTRERVIDAALSVMDAEGLDAVSMRRVAREVGVEAMSLYNHVRDKDDLLQGVCERIMSSFEFPATSGEWVDRAKAGAGEWRRLLQAHPDVMRIFAETHGPAPSSPESLLPTEFALRLFMEAGLSDRDAVQAFHAFGGYIQGFVMMEAGSMKERHEEHFLGAAIPSEEFPALAAASRYWADCDADEQFEFGLDLLIRGLQARVAAGASTPSRTE